MKKHLALFAALLTVLLLVSCNPNDDGSGTTSNDPFTQNFGNSVSRDFIGQVVNESNQPLKGVTVKIGSKTAQTDFNGVFIINNASVYERFAYITAKKSGYIDGSRAMVPTTGKNNVKIMMMSDTNVHHDYIPSGQASEVTLSNGTKVNFDGAFQDESGNAYSGNVSVAAFHLEASNENLSSLMPGMLYAKDSNGEEKALETYGMMHVELRGDNGQKLQIANGHTAQITMAIDETQLATAPNTILLWHFDEAKGYWIEEGSATRVGNNYVGNVSHFSFWNPASDFATVYLNVNVRESNGNPIPNVYVSINLTNFNHTGGGFTGNTGQVSGFVPANEPLTLTVYDNICVDAVLNTSQIGPLSVDTTLPTITIGNEVLASRVTGNLLKCNNANVTNGYVVLETANGRVTFSPVINGVFDFNALYCGNNVPDFTLKGVDYESATETTISNHVFASSITNVGNLTACNVINEYISYQIDGGETIYAYGVQAGPIPVMSGGLGTELNVSGSLANGQIISITGDINTPGVYTTDTYHYGISGPFGGIYAGWGDTPVNTMSFNLINHGNFGEYIDLTFSGTYTNQTGTHTLNGVVHVIRTR